ncbi:MAG TPA: sodium:solute symporter family protein [Vicinamibacteria bacterium]|nr:sodium:solute symporter family protein [Vicinamibacteria bacterium]
MTVDPSLGWLLGATLILYVIALYVLCFMIQGRIQSSEDFLVAGRRLSLPLSTATLLGTWFGAGTILAATDEVRREGLQRSALEPLGAGFCLILAGLFFAKPLWEMKLLTVSDFFRERFDRRAELLSAAVMVPSYFGWIAAQFVALAGMLNLFFGTDMTVGILIVAAVAVGYTLMGGMWSVTLTDAVQITLVLVGLVLLGASSFAALGDGSILAGLERLWTETPPEMRMPIPIGSAQLVLEWLAVFAVGALGNLPGQDLMQRVFASRSGRIASSACVLAGALYITFGLIPVTLGLVGRLLFPEDLERAVLPALAHGFLSPGPAIVFTVMLASAVLSTIDSAILSPASVLSQNVFHYWNRGRLSSLTLNRLAVVLVTLASIGFALAGQRAYALLEDAYELPLAGMFVPLVMGIYGKPRSAAPAIASMGLGLVLWLVHYFADWTYFLEPWTGELPLAPPASITITAFGFVVYIIVNAASKRAE